MTTKGLRQPEPVVDPTDLRHLVSRVAHEPAPRVRDAGVAKLRVDAHEVAVLSDVGLTERQKQSLLDVYSSFLALNAAEEAAAGVAGEGEANGKHDDPGDASIATETSDQTTSAATDENQKG